MEETPDLPTGYGQVAYRGYFEASGGASLISGQPLPQWHEQSQAIREAWDAAAAAVVEYVDRIPGAR